MNLFEPQENGYGNMYYAVAVRSMLLSWHNFFFMAFDPGGFITTDKPPLGFWLQVLCAKLFGFIPYEQNLENYLLASNGNTPFLLATLNTAEVSKLHSHLKKAEDEKEDLCDWYPAIDPFCYCRSIEYRN